MSGTPDRGREEGPAHPDPQATDDARRDALSRLANLPADRHTAGDVSAILREFEAGDAKSPKARAARAGRTVKRLNHRWCLPPVLQQAPGETLEGLGILDDDGTEAALVLWMCVRDVTLWASTPPDRREQLFSPAAARELMERIASARLPHELEVAVTTLCAVLEMPGTVNAEIVSLVCHQIARWAEKGGRLATATAYAVASSAAQPEEGACAREVGRLAMRRGHLTWAETWVRRAIGLARRGKDWESYGLAYLDLAEIHGRRGLRDQAIVYYRMAARTGRRHGMREIRAGAFHGVARLRLDQADGADEAEKYALLALRAYGRAHALVPDVLRDLARIWILQGRYDRAVTVLRRELARPDPPELRIRNLALLARAAAGAGAGARADARTLYDSSWAGAWNGLDEVTAATQDAALLDLAHAAALARDGQRLAQADQRHQLLPNAHPANVSAMAHLTQQVAGRGGRG